MREKIVKIVEMIKGVIPRILPDFTGSITLHFRSSKVESWEYKEAGRMQKK